MEKRISLLIAGLVCGVQINAMAPAAPVDSNVQTLFDTFNALVASMQNDTAFFTATQTSLSSLQDDINRIEALRVTTLAAIVAVFNRYQAAYATCQANQQSITADLAQQRMLAANALDRLRNVTQAEITQLQGHVDSLNAKINAKTIAYNTLAQLDQTKADQMLAALNVFKSQYQGYVATRSAFLSSLDAFKSTMDSLHASKNASLINFATAQAITACVNGKMNPAPAPTPAPAA